MDVNHHNLKQNHENQRFLKEDDLLVAGSALRCRTARDLSHARGKVPPISGLSNSLAVQDVGKLGHVLFFCFSSMRMVL